MSTLDLGITARPCWAAKGLANAVAENFEIGEDCLYYDLQGSEFRWRVPLDPETHGLPRMLWAPDGFELESGPIEARVVTRWGWQNLILDPEWFSNLPIEHDGVAESFCEECAKLDAWVTGPGWREELERRRQQR